MNEIKSLYCALPQENFDNLLKGKISRIEYDHFSMYQQFDFAVSKARQILSSPEKRECVYIICELQYDIDTLLQLHLDKKLIAPAWWLISNKLIDSNKIDPVDLKLFESVYSHATFDFCFFGIKKHEIIRAHSYRLGSEPTLVSIYNI